MLCWGKAVYILNKTPTQFDAFHGLYHSFVCSTYIVVTICCRVWVCLEIQNLKIQNGVTGVTNVCQILLNGL